MKASTVTAEEAVAYTEFYQQRQGHLIAVWEAELLATLVPPRATVLSVGCGPARVEEELLQCRPDCSVVGVDVSREMLGLAPPAIVTVLGEAERLPFAPGVFDRVMCIASLEFVGHPAAAVAESYRVLRPQGRLVVLMLNPESLYFKQSYQRPESYIRRYIRHPDPAKMERLIARWFTVTRNEYHLEIPPADREDSCYPERASLCLLEGKRG